ncbi:hypothetical protein VNO78_25334 [Psophocarpus tetragonolobus]|uniref:Uncharacterized protein n=1 Tax=Psophocarpus tetragonolobus TaxID=3891 RepID=A0AAN9S6Q6_PSOTE
MMVDSCFKQALCVIIRFSKFGDHKKLNSTRLLHPNLKFSTVEATKDMVEVDASSIEDWLLHAHVPNLVQLLDPSPQNTAKICAVSCLGALSPSKKCKKLMISYGAIGYLKKLTEMDIPGAKKLLEQLERGKLRSLFSRN